MTIRHATMDDLDIISLIETTSFHKTEAAKKEEIKERLELNGDFFWLLDDFGEVLAFVHGLPTNAVNLTDDMFHTPEKYDVNGDWLMLLSVFNANWTEWTWKARWRTSKNRCANRPRRNNQALLRVRWNRRREPFGVHLATARHNEQFQTALGVGENRQRPLHDGEHQQGREAEEDSVHGAGLHAVQGRTLEECSREKTVNEGALPDVHQREALVEGEIHHVGIVKPNRSWTGVHRHQS